MKFIYFCAFSLAIYFCFHIAEEKHLQAKEELKKSIISSQDAFALITQKENEKNQRDTTEQPTKQTTEQARLVEKSMNSVVNSLESSLSPEAGFDEKSIKMLEEDPRKSLEEISALLVRNPHSQIWNNSLNLIKNARIDPDLKIDFLKKQLIASGGFTEDENHNLKVVNQYQRILETMKKVYQSESRDFTPLVEEITQVTPDGELQELTRSILNENHR